MLRHLLKLLGDPRFSKVDFAAVKKHISFFNNLTAAEIKYAAKVNKESIPALEYNVPNLTTLKPFIDPTIYDKIVVITKADSMRKFRSLLTLAGSVDLGLNGKEELEAYLAKECTDRVADDSTTDSSNSSATIVSENLIELRKVFVDLLDKAYDEQFDSGEVDVRDVNLVVTYKTSVELTRDFISKGNPINDWNIVLDFMAKKGKLASRLGLLRDGAVGSLLSADHGTLGAEEMVDNNGVLKHISAKDLIHYVTGYIEAHRRAQKAFKLFAAGSLFSDEEIQVLDESNAQIQKAEESFKRCDSQTATTIVAHLVCRILLHKGAEWIGELNEQGMLKDQEAEHFLEEIQHDIDGVEACRGEWVLLPCAGDDDCDHTHEKKSITELKSKTKKELISMLLEKETEAPELAAHLDAQEETSPRGKSLGVGVASSGSAE